MSTDNDTSLKVNPAYIYYGDSVSFLVDDLGYLACPSAEEPIPERADFVSHLRLAPCAGTQIFPADFSYR